MDGRDTAEVSKGEQAHGSQSAKPQSVQVAGAGRSAALPATRRAVDRLSSPPVQTSDLRAAAK